MITDIDTYIRTFPETTQVLLQQVRAAIIQGAPEATELISYQMPAFKSYGKVLVYFAGFKNHIGFYAMPSGHVEFKNELSKYKQGKGSVQFPINEPLPLDLITSIAEYRNYENKMKSEKK